MKRSHESTLQVAENSTPKKFHGVIEIPGDITAITLDSVPMAGSIIDLHSESPEEIINVENATPVLQISTNNDHNYGVIAEHMDITEPLSTLRTILERRLGIDLSDYDFYLQDAQELDASKNLVNQCVQGEGLVQINIDLTNKGGKKKINIVDVLKPAEQITLSSEFISQGNETADNNNVQKFMIPVPEDTEQVTRWIVSPEFLQVQEKYKIPADPLLWSAENVKHWVQWASRHFNLPNINLDDWALTGKQLFSITHEEFTQKVPFYQADLFWTHLELLRKCKIVAIIQPPSSAQLTTTVQNSEIKALAMKNRTRPNKIGIPRVAFEGHPGNNGQIQLWQFLLDLLTDKEQREYIQWVGDEGEFKLLNPEMVAQLWGQRKNKPTMNYEKLSRALRYYYDGEMIAKVHGKRFVYKFVCDLKSLIGYDASKLNKLVTGCCNKKFEKSRDEVDNFIYHVDEDDMSSNS